MGKDYSNYERHLDQMNDFIERSIKVDKSPSLPGFAKVRNFFRALNNLVFGDHKWYSYGRARSVVKFYATRSDNLDSNTQVKVVSLFKKLKDHKSHFFTAEQKRDFAARFRVVSTPHETRDLDSEDPVPSPQPQDPAPSSQPPGIPPVDRRSTGADDTDQDMQFQPQPISQPQPQLIPQPQPVSQPQPQLIPQPQPVSQPQPQLIPQPQPVSRPQPISEPIGGQQSTQPGQVLSTQQPPPKPPKIPRNSPNQTSSPASSSQTSSPASSSQTIIQPKAPEITENQADMRASLRLVDKSKLPRVSSELLFQLIGDEFGENSALEGLGPTEVLTYLLAYLKERNQTSGKVADCQAELIMQLEKALAIAKSNFSPETLKRSIQTAFDTRTPCLIPGGWVGNPLGHVVYYELIPDPKNAQKATLRIFNTGEGAEEHPSVQIGVKQKVVHAEWREIDRESLLDPHFLSAMCEMNTQTASSNQDTLGRTDYNYRHVYISLKEMLKVSPDNCLNEEILLNAPSMQMQRAGTGAFRSLTAYMNTKMTRNELRRFICDLRIQAISSHNVLNRKEDKTLIKRGLGKLSRSVDTLFEKKVISKTYRAEALASLKQVEQSQKSPKPASSAANGIEIPESITPVGVEVYHREPKKLPGLAQGEEIELEISNCSHLLAKISEIDTNKSPTAQLEEALQYLKIAKQQKEFDAMHFAIIELIAKIDNKFVDSIPDNWEAKQQLIEQLNQLGKLFFEANQHRKQAYVLFPEAHLAMHKLLTLQCQLAEICHPDTANVFDLKLHPAYLQIHSEEQLKNTSSLDNPLKIFFQLTLGNYIRREDVFATLKYTFLKDDTLDPNYLNRLIESKSPGKMQEITKNIHSYELLSQGERYVKIFASSHLPPWLISIRETFQRLHWINTIKLGQPNTDEEVKKHFEVLSSRVMSSPIKADPTGEEFIMNTFVQSADASLPRFDVRGLRKIQDVYYDSNKFEEALSQRYESNPFLHGYNSLQWSQTDTEKKLLTADHTEWHEGMSPEITKQINHLLINPKVTLIETLEFFQKHPDKIYDPTFQMIFQTACFSRQSIKELKPATAELVASFLKRQLDNSIAQNDPVTSTFLLRMHRYFSHFESYKNVALQLEEQRMLEMFVLRPSLKPEEKSYLYTELAAIIAEKDNPSEDDLYQFLKAVHFKQHNALPEKWADPKVDYEIQKGLHKFSKRIHEYLLPAGGVNQQAINAFFQESTGENNAVWRLDSNPEQELVFISDRQDVFIPLKQGVRDQKSLLPLELRIHPTFKKLFPTCQHAIEKAPGHYEFTDTDGRKVTALFNQESDDIQIFKEIDGKIYYHFTDDLTPSSYLYSYFSKWQSTDSSFEFLLMSENDPKDVKYSILTKAGGHHDHVEEIIRRSDGALLSGSNSSFSNFENSRFIHEWYDREGKLVEVELPRFALTFQPKKTGPAPDKIGAASPLYALEYPGYYVAKNQTVSNLKHSKNHLVLENEDGHQILLLPKSSLQKNQNKEVLLGTPAFDQHLNKEKLGVYTYSIHESAIIEAGSKQANLHLAMIFAANQKYQQAAKWLRNNGEKLSGYNQEEIEDLTQIAQMKDITGDHSGEMTALSLFAAYLLTTNTSEASRNAGSSLLKDLYGTYLERYQNITHLKLEKDEELWILKTLLSNQFDSRFFARLTELDPTYANQFPYSKEKPKPLSKADPKDVLSGMYIYVPNIRHGNPPKTPTSGPITKVGQTIQRSIIEYIRIAKAKKDDPEITKWLHSAATFMKGSSDKEIAPLGSLLERVLESPDDFITLADFKSLKGRNPNAVQSWWSATLETAFKDYNPNSTPLNIPQDLTPPYYRLDRTHKPISTLHFRLNVSENASSDKVSSSLKQQHIQKLPAQENVSEEEYREMEAYFEGQTDQTDAENPLLKKEWTRLKADLTAYKNQPPKKVYTLKRDVGEIKNELIADIQKDNTGLKVLEDQIKKLANAYPASDDKKTLRLLGGTDRKIELDDIILSFSQQNPASLYALNEHLTQESSEHLYALTADYLALSSLKSQRERCLETCKKCQKSSPEEKDDLEKLLAEQILAKRAYNIEEHPAYLVFEYYSGMIIRQDQLKMLDAFLNGEMNNPIREMIMGSGKSKVLLPLLGLLRANKQDLSLLVVPQPLFESISSDTQKILGNAFSKSLRTLHFDRNSTFSYRTLEGIRDNLKAVIENQECLIMTSKSINALLLKFVEHTNELYLQGKIEDENTPLMREILQIFSNTSLPLIDEADSVLNVLREVSFSIGEKQPPKAHEAVLIAELFQLLYTDAELKKIAKLDSDMAPNDDAQPLTKDRYHESLKQPLAEKLLERLIRVDFQNETKNQAMRSFLSQLKGSERTTLIDYLTRNDKNIQAAQAFYETIPANIQDIFALASEEISHFLPHTLVKMIDENYGLDDNVFAIPYTAASTPSKGSIYNNPHITMNYTFALHNKKGIDKNVLKMIMATLFREAEFEKNEKMISLSETEAFKKFAALKGDIDINLGSFTEDQLEALKQFIDASSERKSQIIVQHIFPKIEIYAAKLSCNPMMLMGFLNNPTGFTGTLHTPKTIHRKSTPQPEITTDAKSFVALWRQQNTRVAKVEKGSSIEMLEAIANQQIPFDMICDAGGYFKDCDNKTFAAAIEEKFEKPTVFYNSRNEQAITDGALEKPFSTSKLESHERFTYLDQSHTVGADVPQRLKAVSLVTIGRNMTLRDLYQAVWRTRGLGKGQTVTYLIDEEVETIIREKLKLPITKRIGFLEIYAFVVQNKCEVQGDDNFKAFNQELWGLVQQLLINTLIQPNVSPQDRELAFEKLQNHWIKEQDASAAQSYGQIAVYQPKDDVINQACAQCEKVLQEIATELPFLRDEALNCIDEIAPIAEKYRDELHPKVLSSASNSEMTVETETKTQAEVRDETETETSDLKSNRADKITLGSFDNPPAEDIRGELEDFLHPKNRIFNIGAQMRLEPDVAALAPHFNGVEAVTNVLEWDNVQGDEAPKKLFGEQRTPIHHLRVEGDRVVFLSLKEAHLSNYNLTLGSTIGQRPISMEARKKILKLKFLNGECLYTKEELTILKEWLEQAGPKNMRKFFLNVILKDKPETRTTFAKSSLGKLFNEINV